MAPRCPLKITGRISSVTNGFVQAILPRVPPSECEMQEALAVLGQAPERRTCVYCGAGATDWDHLTPLVRGKRPTGALNDARNLVPACGPCNQSKGGQHWRTWMTGQATGSPSSRCVSDINARIACLERFEAWGTADRFDLAAIVGVDLWQGYWDKLSVIETLMRQAQEQADLIRVRIESAVAVGNRL